MVAFGELRRCDTDYWHALATRLRNLAVRVDRHAGSVTHVGGRLSVAWDGGPAGSAALSRVKGHAARLGASNDVLLAAANLLDGHAATMAGYRNRLNAAIGRGESSVCMPGGQRMVFIHDDGRVSLTVPHDLNGRPTVGDQALALLRQARDEIDHEIRETLRLATEADQSAARRINEHVPAVALSASSPAAARVPESAVPTHGAPPGDVRRWWGSLTPQQQQYVIEHYPSGSAGSTEYPPTRGTRRTESCSTASTLIFFGNGPHCRPLWLRCPEPRRGLPKGWQRSCWTTTRS